MTAAMTDLVQLSVGLGARRRRPHCDKQSAETTRLFGEIDSTPYGPAERELIERAITLAE